MKQECICTRADQKEVPQKSVVAQVLRQNVSDTCSLSIQGCQRSTGRSTESEV
jgi:hypothetical protein